METDYEHPANRDGYIRVNSDGKAYSVTKDTAMVECTQRWGDKKMTMVEHTQRQKKTSTTKNQ